MTYLKPNVKMEPLIDQWYAWPHLIPPATAARNMTERHLRIMDSYISAPQVHASAVKNPKLLGGPFMDYGGGRVNEVRELRDRTKRERAHLLALSAALEALDNMLRASAKGFSLQPLYGCVPDILRGYVELCYDLNNNASFRLIEPLLYKTRYYDQNAQSFVLSAIEADDRPFLLSTPRLEDDSAVHLRIPFADGTVDSLAEMTRRPQPLSTIQDAAQVPDKFVDLFRSLFTTDPPAPYLPYTGSGVRWRYFGHACILVETRNFTALLDPVLSYTYESDISRYTYMDLPESIDYVLITHNHQDHVLFETLLQIRHKVKTIVVPPNSGGTLQDPSLKLLLQNTGFCNVIELREMEELPLADGSITAVPFLGEHADLNIVSKSGYLIRKGRHSLLFAADSCNIEPRLYEHLHREFGPVDALFLGMECNGAPLTWLYGPLLTRKIDRGMDESRRLAGSDYEQAVRIVEQFQCKDVYVYAMGQEPWLNYVMSLKYTAESRPIMDSNKLIATCRGRGVCAERLFGEKEILLN